MLQYPAPMPQPFMKPSLIPQPELFDIRPRSLTHPLSVHPSIHLSISWSSLYGVLPCARTRARNEPDDEPLCCGDGERWANRWLQGRVVAGVIASSLLSYGEAERWMPDYYQVWGSWEGFLKTLLLMGLAFIFRCICLIFTGTLRSFIFSALEPSPVTSTPGEVLCI